ncbi:MAG: permease [Actinobacteria bacterium]|nr:permease [Actinomycetota bacterium]NIU71561.1 permease [Actinomycetota bacterium]NIW33511.1 permease [Actinomycetota bacterium]NIX25617.1 permease [Actinomycetota bacterium]
MNLQRPVAVAGAAVTTFLLVGAATLEAVFAATRADVGPGIVGVLVGVAAGLVAATLVASRWRRVGPRGRSLLLGYAAFGLTVVFLAGLSYVNVPGADDLLSVPVDVAIAAAVAVLVAAGRGRLTRT